MLSFPEQETRSSINMHTSLSLSQVVMDTIPQVLAFIGLSDGAHSRKRSSRPLFPSSPSTRQSQGEWTNETVSWEVKRVGTLSPPPKRILKSICQSIYESTEAFHDNINPTVYITFLKAVGTFELLIRDVFISSRSWIWDIRYQTQHEIQTGTRPGQTGFSSYANVRSWRLTVTMMLACQNHVEKTKAGLLQGMPGAVCISGVGATHTADFKENSYQHIKVFY